MIIKKHIVTTIIMAGFLQGCVVTDDSAYYQPEPTYVDSGYYYSNYYPRYNYYSGYYPYWDQTNGWDQTYFDNDYSINYYGNYYGYHRGYYGYHRGWSYRR
jgi:hypothetical protein